MSEQHARQSAAAAFAAHCQTWNAKERDAWLALFADDVTLEDPVGTPTKHGRAALETTWQRSHTAGRSWRLEPQRVIECGDEVAVDLLNVGNLGDRIVHIRSIEIWKVGSDGRVNAVRAFFNADAEVHDPFYVPDGPPA